jgi:tetratricopeptide (TPR) repeat protein
MPSIDELEGLIARFPDKPFPRYGLAMEYKKARRFDEAVAQFQEAVKLDPKYVAAFMHCGLCLREAGRADEAKQTLQQGLQVAQRAGNTHAAGEIAGILQEMGVES